MASGKAVLCGAGFETPAEAMFLKKNLLVIPMKNQYEQQCNAAALSEMGVPMLKSLKKKHIPLIENWLHNSKPVRVDYSNETEAIVQKLISEFLKNKQEEVEFPFFMENEILSGY
jgi:UDP-N-acetylglucosamine:LPS N-acetylglucosamine transferase